MKTLLIVFHTGGVKTAQMAAAVERGARGAVDESGGVRVVVKRCADAGPQDVLAADGLILGTPENFGYMSGMMKDFLERVFYACEGKVNGRPWALFVGAGQDGSGAVAEGGVNIVIHEFAHKLDMMAGEADGVPPLPSRAARERWIEVFNAEFDRFCKSVEAGNETFLDPYAAEHEAEFFAVASEAFFESPNALLREYPRLYDLFKGFYKQNPAGRLET